MCGLFKKRNARKRAMRDFRPAFGILEDFEKKYANGSDFITIGKFGDHNVNVAINGGAAKKITIINDNEESIFNHCIAPIVAQGKMSYIVYDESGECYERLAEQMREKCYDVQLVDLANEEHPSRINLFEIVNITREPRYLAKFLADTLELENEEKAVAQSLLLAMMQYELAEHGIIDIVALNDLFNQLKMGDETGMLSVENCQYARANILNVYEANSETREAAFQALSEKFFDLAVDKVKNPNIFAITMHNKHSVMFVKKVPEQYRFLVTALMFNLEASNTICGLEGVGTILLNNSEEDWMQQKMLDKIRVESNDVDNGCYFAIDIKKVIDAKAAKNNELFVYMHSTDVATNTFVYNHLKLKNFSDEEQREIAKRVFGSKKLQSEVAERASMDMNEMKSIDGAIAIDVTHEVKPILFDRVERYDFEEQLMEREAIKEEIVEVEATEEVVVKNEFVEAVTEIDDEEIVKNEASEEQSVESAVVEEGVEEAADVAIENVAESEEMTESEKVAEVEIEDETNRIVEETSENNEA